MSNEQTSTSADMAEIAPPRRHTKAERLLELLRTGTGASLEDMIEATGLRSLARSRSSFIRTRSTNAPFSTNSR